MSYCKKHGETEFTEPNKNGDSYCKTCMTEDFVQKWMEKPQIKKRLLEILHEMEMGDSFVCPVSMGARVEPDKCSLCGEEVSEGHLKLPRKIVDDEK